MRLLSRLSGVRARHAAVTALLTVTTAVAVPVTTAPSATALTATKTTKVTNAFLIAKSRYVGKVPYRYGGTSPRTGFDCSGMTQYAYATQGLKLPRTATQQRAAVKRISRSQARAGDLVFFPSGSGVSHVGIYAGNNMMVDAGSSRRGIMYRAIYTSNVQFGTLR
jgi:cell wall-associated NlpC family hydrolase